MVNIDKSLHFIVRHPQYQQTPEYGVMLNQMLHAILGAQAGRQEDVKGQYLISDIQSAMQTIGEARRAYYFDMQTNEKMEVLGSIAHSGFGDPDFFPISTFIAGGYFPKKPEFIRAYQDIFTELYGSQANLEKDFQKVFDYPDPNNPLSRFKLMTVTSPKTMIRNLLSSSDLDDEKLGTAIERNHGMVGPQEAVLFFHPRITSKFREKLSSCILNVLNDDQPSEEKIAEVYWLLSQSTPVKAGGSAMANLALYALSNAYETTTPYTRDGVDLWAYAAMMPLEDFKDRYLAGEFHDPSITDENVKEYLNKRLLEQKNLSSLRCKSMIEPTSPSF